MTTCRLSNSFSVVLNFRYPPPPSEFVRKFVQLKIDMNFCAFYNSIRTRRSRGIVINQSKQYTANKTHAPEPNQYKEIAFSQLKPINLWTRVFKLDKIRFLVLQEICINVWRRVNATYCQCGELTRVMNFTGMHVITPKECAP